MRWRVLGGAVALALAGAAAGYAVGTSERDEAQEPPSPAVADLVPVPAEPSIPVPSVSSDPEDPTLEIDIALDSDLLVVDDEQGKPKYELRLPTPVGWTRRADVETGKWTYTVPGNSTNTYGLRVEILADRGQSVEAATDSRIAELGSAQTQGHMTNLDVEASDDRFTATFIDEARFLRVNIERFFSGPDPAQVFATVAAYGRAEDRDGMADLLDRIAIDLRTTVK